MSNNNQDFCKFNDVKLKCPISHVIDVLPFQKVFFRILSRFYDIFKTHARAHENDVDNEKYIIQKIFRSKFDKNYQNLNSCYNNKKHTNRKPFLGHVIVKTSNHSYDKSIIIFFSLVQSISNY